MMSIRQCGRRVLALAVAYGVALQALLLVFSCPVVGTDAFISAPICSSNGSGGPKHPPAGHDCACLAGCGAGCGAGLAGPMQEPSDITYAPASFRRLPAVAELAPPCAGVDAAHRSRAPPVV